MKIKLSSWFLIYCFFTTKIVFSAITVCPTLTNIFSNELKQSIERNSQQNIQTLLNHDINTFKAAHPNHKWGTIPFTNEDLKKLKNMAFYYLVQYTSVGGSLNALSIDEIEDILIIFLQNNLDINVNNIDWECSRDCTPLNYAILLDNYVLLELLIKHGADINNYHILNVETPLRLALRLNRPNVVRLLLEWGADLYNIGFVDMTDEAKNEAKKVIKEFLQERKQLILSIEDLYEDVANIINQY